MPVNFNGPISNDFLGIKVEPIKPDVDKLFPITQESLVFAIKLHLEDLNLKSINKTELVLKLNHHIYQYYNECRYRCNNANESYLTDKFIAETKHFIRIKDRNIFYFKLLIQLKFSDGMYIEIESN